VQTKAGDLFKQKIIRYIRDGRRVPAGTPGAKQVIQESRKWYGRLKDPSTGKWVLLPLSPDRRAARTLYAKREAELEQGAAGLVDPFKRHKKGPIEDHVAAYLSDLAEKGRDERYRTQTERLINAVVDGCKVKTLEQLLNAEKVDDFLTSLRCSARTKNTYRQAVIGLCNYLIGKKKLPRPNPLLDTTRRKGEVKRKRRALPKEALQRLLDAARQRPLLEAMTIRRGTRKGELAARLKPETRETAERRGQHRALLYFTAIITGLRLGTLRQLQVCHLDLEGENPAAHVPGRIIKSGRDFLLPLRPDLASELRSWIGKTGKAETDLVFEVKTYAQMSKVLRKDLKRADIPYKDAKGRYFDFHSFRKCTNSFMRQMNVDPSRVQKYLDWTDTTMGLRVYNDEELLDVGPVWEALPKLSIT
jgi:integrase